ncbi:lysosome-associated membrane glycoprotein 3 isoform X2 [Ictalurus punctatus]|uniref:Lysosome-associated membrane glycoprotein 3 isoform X2 n=1 Tax=Ictalurus punctatus TaxID=7998 RepID=A0A2D0RSE3_ICTPU|nr:lysosome-associated membrane glycoprotein 3 isoform X2 [Ictalurus punctatus]
MIMTEQTHIETETPQTDLYRKRPPTAVDMMALPTKNVPIRVAALLSRIPTNITSRAVSFLKMTNAQRIAMRFFILAALLFVGNSVSSEVNDSLSSEVFLNQDTKSQHNMSKKPTLQPKESTPLIETYMLKKDGRVCVMARFGMEFVVKEDKKTLYFNMDPNSTKATGFCANKKIVLSLEFDGGNLEFTFIKDGDKSYVQTLRALLEPDPSCKQCKSKSYPGILDHEKLFETTKVKSFKCQSQTTLKLAENLMIKLIPLKIQAFDLPKGTFGEETECMADYTKRIIPIVVGAVVAGIILISVLVYVLMRERRSQGYEQL